ncbi:hypothetical protein [Nocardioides acrostichi]|uniref:PH domain-containing protein n=1 Tax=Nocardioides acrostichi TaxID=2784339 RepID=A0A930V4S3_9ACTN|nr:hypothetical protein [Nocardioides acrostichi]MBF4163831.1 hypothetical protein [Nocardioides acrostichi]
MDSTNRRDVRGRSHAPAQPRRQSDSSDGDALMARWLDHHAGGSTPSPSARSAPATPQSPTTRPALSTRARTGLGPMWSLLSSTVATAVGTSATVRPVDDPTGKRGSADERDTHVAGHGYHSPQARAAREQAAAAARPAGPGAPDITFKPRTGGRTLAGLVVLAGAVATIWYARLTYVTRSQLDLTLAAVLTFTTAVVWAVRAGSTPAQVSLRGSRLLVDQGNEHHEFDAATARFEQLGRPGRHGWALMVQRRGQGPFRIDGSMVDGRRFVEALRYYHPDL